MTVQIFVAVLISLGLFVLAGINPVKGLTQFFKSWKPEMKIREKKMTAGEFVRRLEGKKRDNLVQKSLRDTHNSLVTIGQEKKYGRTVRLALLCGIGGASAGLILFSSPLLMLVLGLGCGLIPLWITSLSVYSHAKLLNDELETALSMITISYVRHNDIVKAVSETVPYTGSPVKEVLQRFVNVVKYIDGDIEAAVRQMKAELDNSLFGQWCDILILCQSDHTLKDGLLPVADKISELKNQQEENETQMMMPLRNVMQMMLIVGSVFPLLYFLSADWYYYLVHTLWGQCSVAVVAVIMFWSIHKAIKLSKPIDYRI